MPRKSAVTPDQIIPIPQKYMDFFSSDDLPCYTSDILMKISAELAFKWNSHNEYTNVRENRRNILTIARIFQIYE